MSFATFGYDLGHIYIFLLLELAILFSFFTWMRMYKVVVNRKMRISHFQSSSVDKHSLSASTPNISSSIAYDLLLHF